MAIQMVVMHRTGGSPQRFYPNNVRGRPNAEQRFDPGAAEFRRPAGG